MKSILVYIALIAIISTVFAQDSSSSSTVVGDSSSSTGLVFNDSSSSTGLVFNDSSSSTGLVFNDSSSTGFVFNDSSSSTGFVFNDSSSSSWWSGSSSTGPANSGFLPDDWQDIDASENSTTFVVTWGPKDNNNPMFGHGSADGFLIDGESGRFLNLILGNTYSFTIDLNVTTGFCFSSSSDPRGGSALNCTSPVYTGGNNFTITAGNSSFATDSDTIIYYISTTDEYSGGAIRLSQAATTIQVSFMVLIISAFAALIFPKW